MRVLGNRAILCCFCLFLTACSSLISSQTGKLADGLSAAVLNSNDLETVKQGAPAYLLLLDGLIENQPDDAHLLRSGAELYAAYAAAFVTDEQRTKMMANKAMEYAKRSACLLEKVLCAPETMEYQKFSDNVARITNADTLYSLGAAWLAWLQAHSDDWNAIAQLPRPKLLLERVIALDPAHEQGSAHLYLGGIATLLPPAMGGKPEEGREHFEEAIRISQGRNLLAKVIYAEEYARLMFDRPLHDRLLSEVLASEATADGMTLSNVLAQQQARVLLDDSADYF